MNLLPLLQIVSEDTIDTGSEIVAPAFRQHSVVDLVFGSGPVVQVSLVILALASVVTWGIILTKWAQLRRAKLLSDKFSEVFWSSRNLAQISEASEEFKDSPVATVYAAGHNELTKIMKTQERAATGDFGYVESIERALKRAKAEELTRLENGITFLATTASAAPFVGLFGTIWGVMNAFIGLSSAKSSSIQAVAPGISEALISTAIGLAAAIPASIAYNYFSQQIRVLARHMDMFSAEFLNIAKRHFL